MEKNNIISDWLDKYGDPEIDKFIEIQLNQNKMTPKEKAKELVTMYAATTVTIMGCGASEGNPCIIENVMFTNSAKKCALIAVDEVLKLPNLGRSHNGDESQYDYWKEVKEHIINL